MKLGQLSLSRKVHSEKAAPSKLLNPRREQDAEREADYLAQRFAGDPMWHMMPRHHHVSGEALDPAMLAFAESRFAHDFSRVRVHTDTTAAAAAKSLGALALTKDNDVAFDAGQYDTSTMAGRKLLAHELAHVKQQALGFRPLPQNLWAVAD